MKAINWKFTVFIIILWIVQEIIAAGKSAKQKLHALESKLNIMEIRMNLNSNDLIELQQNFAALNQSLYENKLCQIEGASQKASKEVLDVETEILKIREIETMSAALRSAFKEEKSWTHQVTELQRSRTEALIVSFGDFKQQIQNNLDVMTQTDEATGSHFETKLNGEISELRSTISRTLSDLISEVNLMKTSIEEVEKEVSALKKVTADNSKGITKNLARLDDFQSKINDEIQKIRKDARDLCPQNWRTFTGYCYLLYTNSVTFDSVIDTCSKNASSVADINSEDELEYVKRMSGRNIWIGITDKDTEGQWKAVRNEKQVVFTNWGPSQPQNFATYDEDCAVMRTAGEWHDYKCNHTFSFVCKKMVN